MPMYNQWTSVFASVVQNLSIMLRPKDDLLYLFVFFSYKQLMLSGFPPVCSVIFHFMSQTKPKMAVTVCHLSCQCSRMILPASEWQLGSGLYLPYLSDGVPHCLSPRGFTYQWLWHPAFSQQGLIIK